MFPPAPSSTLFPYPTLFRSHHANLLSHGSGDELVERYAVDPGELGGGFLDGIGQLQWVCAFAHGRVNSFRKSAGFNTRTPNREAGPKSPTLCVTIASA